MVHPTTFMSECSVTAQLEFVKADIAAYRELARYHYRDGALGPYCAIYALAERCLRRRKTAAFAGVIVIAPAPLNCASRRRATGEFFAGRSKAQTLALLNANVRRISRVIVEPRYRGLGLGAQLVRQTLPQCDTALVEAVATMGAVHPFFERAGMRVYPTPPDPLRQCLLDMLADAGIDNRLWIDPPAAHRHLESLPACRRELLDATMRLFLNRFGRRRTLPDTTDRTAFILNRLCQTPTYYAWHNPNRPLADGIC